MAKTLLESQLLTTIQSYERWIYSLGLSGFGAGFGAGLAFVAGRETPKLMRRKPNPLRSEPSMLIVPLFPIPSQHINVDGAVDSHSWPDYFPEIGAFAAAGAAVTPFNVSSAAGGRGLSALASKRLTCHISVSDKICL
jgi:hypothetical protein